jgi:hypothetical protein
MTCFPLYVCGPAVVFAIGGLMLDLLAKHMGLSTTFNGSNLHQASILKGMGELSVGFL